MCVVGSRYEGQRVLMTMRSRTKSTSVLLVVLLIAAASGGCAKQSDTAGSTQAARSTLASTAPAPPRNEVEPPSLPPASAVWKEEALTPGERGQAGGLGAAYFGMEPIADPGFPEVPTAQDWAEASRMTDDELRRRAEGGDTKAKFLWADRLLGVAEKELKQTGSSEKALDAFVLVGELASRSRSPLAAYMFGRQMYNLGTTHNPAYVVAALQVGYSRGDTRARNALEAFEARHPNIDEALVRQIIDSMETPHGRSS